MKPLKQNEVLNIVIYAQSGILAGDLAALLSGSNIVNRQTSLPGVINSINSQTDVLLLVAGGLDAPLPDPADVLMVAEQFNCKVIMLGNWPGTRQHESNERNPGSVITFSEIPTPAALFEIIGTTASGSG